MSEIISNLYIGNLQDSESMKNIDMVINCTTILPFYAFNALCIRIPIEDNGDPMQEKKLYQFIADNKLFKKIDNYLNENKKILCHCLGGRQRSCTVIACYLIWKYQMNSLKAIEFIKEKRKDAFFSTINFMSTINLYHQSVIKSL